MMGIFVQKCIIALAITIGISDDAAWPWRIKAGDRAWYFVKGPGISGLTDQIDFQRGGI